MIRLIHRYKHSIAIVFMFIAFCFAISGVGMSALDAFYSRERTALRINDRKVSFTEFNRTEQQFKKRLDPRIAQAFEAGIRQQTVDALINDAVERELAKNLKLTASGEEIRRKLGPISQERYRQLLRSAGMTAREFEEQIAWEVEKDMLAGFIADSAVVAPNDAQQRFIEQETAYSVSTASFQAPAFAAAVAEPSQEELTKFYEAHATEYELAPRVAYDYVVLESKAFEKDVVISQEDVEMYYTENAPKFSLPEEVRVRAVTLSYPSKADDKKRAEVKERAEKAHQEASAGKAFEEVVKTYSDDTPAKKANGERGWVVKGKSAKSFDDVAFTTAVGSVGTLIESDTGFEIIKVEEKREARVRPLDEVRREIEAQLRQAEAPAYAVVKAQELVAAGKAQKQPLAETVKQLGLSAKSTSGVIDAATDPSTDLVGLTEEALKIPSSDHGTPTLIELKGRSVLVQVTDFKDTTTPPLSEIREKVLAQYRQEESVKVAQRKADELLVAVKQAPQTFLQEARSKGATVAGPTTISRREAPNAGLHAVTPQMRAAVMAVKAPDTVIPQVFPGDESFSILLVSKIDRPDPASPANKEKVASYRVEADRAAANQMMQSTLALLKGRATIEQDPTILGAQ